MGSTSLTQLKVRRAASGKAAGGHRLLRPRQRPRQSVKPGQAGRGCRLMATGDWPCVVSVPKLGFTLNAGGAPARAERPEIGCHRPIGRCWTGRTAPRSPQCANCSWGGRLSSRRSPARQPPPSFALPGISGRYDRRLSVVEARSGRRSWQMRIQRAVVNVPRLGALNRHARPKPHPRSAHGCAASATARTVTVR